MTLMCGLSCDSYPGQRRAALEGEEGAYLSSSMLAVFSDCVGLVIEKISILLSDKVLGDIQKFYLEFLFGSVLSISLQ